MAKISIVEDERAIVEDKYFDDGSVGSPESLFYVFINATTGEVVNYQDFRVRN